MTGEQTEKLLDRATSDASFHARLLKDPRATARELGVDLTDEEASTIASMSADDVRTFAQQHRSATDPAMRRAAC
jgi:hypothetical protein